MTSAYRAYFNQKIWSKGNQYYEQGRVRNLTYDGKHLEATVAGTRQYHVAITLKPLQLDCTCPYASEGHRCKHMSATLIAFEQGNDTKKIDKKRGYQKYSWYPYIEKSLDRRGNIDYMSSYYHGLVRYWNYDYDTFHLTHMQYIEEMIVLMKFTIDRSATSYRTDDVIEYCIGYLSQERTHADEATKPIIDNMIKATLQKAKDEHLISYIVCDYFTEEADIPFIITYLKQFSYSMWIIPKWLAALTDNGASDDVILPICLEFSETKAARTWLMKYYEQTEQFEQGVQLLEAYCNSEAKLNEDLSQEQLALFQFYTKLGRTKASDSIFQALMKNKKVKKTVLFSKLKSSMTEEEWISKGKQLVRDWTNGKKDETCYEIFRIVNAGDLMIEHMILNGYNYNLLRENSRLIASYDPGILYAFFKKALSHDLRSDFYSPYQVISNFTYSYPKTPESIEALKVMLVELQEEFYNSPSILSRLEELEERVYEAE